MLMVNIDLTWANEPMLKVIYGQFYTTISQTWDNSSFLMMFLRPIFYQFPILKVLTVVPILFMLNCTKTESVFFNEVWKEVNQSSFWVWGHKNFPLLWVTTSLGDLLNLLWLIFGTTHQSEKPKIFSLVYNLTKTGLILSFFR